MSSSAAGLEALTTNDFTAWLRPDGLTQIAWRPAVVIDGPMARAALSALREASGRQPRGLLVDMRSAGPMDKEARSAFAQAEEWVPAVALWVQSPLSVVIANFFLHVSRTSRPTRLFTNEADAVDWLTSTRA